MSKSEHPPMNKLFADKKNKMAVRNAEDDKVVRALSEGKNAIKATKEYQEIDAEVDALHQRMSKNTSTAPTLTIATSNYRNWYRYAVAASLIGVVATTMWYLMPNNVNPTPSIVKTNPVTSDSLTPSKVTQEKNTIVQNSSTKYPNKSNEQNPSVLPSASDAQVLTNIQKQIIDDFYKEQLNKISIATLSISKDSLLQTAKTNLKQEKSALALPQFLALHAQFPSDETITLYLALCYCKQQQLKN
ncbi:MAG: hypothetical protein RLZZ292_2734, partial [Bacteroidota bacterium]